MPEMQTSECGKQIEGTTAAYPCYLAIDHDGPHAARELQVTERRRIAWVEQQQAGVEARAVLAQSQGNAQSFHELRGEVDASGKSAGTPVPGSGLQPREFRQMHQPKVGEDGEQVDPQVQRDWLRQTLIASGMGEDQVAAMIEAANISKTEPSKSTNGRQSLAEVLAQPAEGPSVPFVSHGPPEVVSEPTKQREGDQPLPVKNNPRPAAQDLIIEMANESKRVGTERYGQPLKPLNGRDTFADLVDEARDFFVYSACLKMERYEMISHAEAIKDAVALPLDVVKDLEVVKEHLDPLVLWLKGTPQT